MKSEMRSDMNGTKMPGLNSVLRALLAAITLCLVPGGAFAWGDGGHMMVAYIAQERLTPTARSKAESLLGVPIKPTGPFNATKDFVNAAHWADDVKKLPGFEFSGDLHFVDYPFTMDGSDLPEDLPKADNIIGALESYVGLLKADNASQLERAEALRFIIHLVGDIHQPLHCATRISKSKPEGDTGGNAFQIATRSASGKRVSTKLHSYWDGGIGQFPRTGANFAPPPLSEIPPAAQTVMTAFPPETEDWKASGTSDFVGWAAESEKLASTFAYKGLVAGKEPNAAYVKKARQITQQRVAWGGYRLAALLNDIFR